MTERTSCRVCSKRVSYYRIDDILESIVADYRIQSPSVEVDKHQFIGWQTFTFAANVSLLTVLYELQDLSLLGLKALEKVIAILSAAVNLFTRMITRKYVCHKTTIFSWICNSFIIVLL